MSYLHPSLLHYWVRLVRLHVSHELLGREPDESLQQSVAQDHSQLIPAIRERSPDAPLSLIIVQLIHKFQQLPLYRYGGVETQGVYYIHTSVLGYQVL